MAFNVQIIHVQIIIVTIYVEIIKIATIHVQSIIFIHPSIHSQTYKYICMDIKILSTEIVDGNL